MKTATIEQARISHWEMPLQPASHDIWDRKYRLKTKDGRVIDETLDDTFGRIARALADTEETAEAREQWYERFLWALRNGAIPAGRIVSNAGALEHKPATSTINCTVSCTIPDSMDGILRAVHEAGLTLKAGCGIGYEFSTLRPRGAFVSGAGAYTSGPLSFMDIFDAMCFTVSSAGGRRGAQMGTFDISHPDVMDFIRAKRENGRLRQFNLSCLITDEFMQAVKDDGPWDLAFPAAPHELDDPATRIVWRRWPSTKGYRVNELGEVACRVYRTVPARRLWNLIMSSTYDYAEPGFILIDRINEMNNNWFCEEIRATNPCVTADSWVHTAGGPRQVGDLLGMPFDALVDGRVHRSAAEGFFRTGRKPVLRLRTAEGYSLRLTSDHPVRRVSRLTGDRRTTEWCRAGELRGGDHVVLNNHRGATTWPGSHSGEQGYLIGLLIAAGTPAADGAALSQWQRPAVANGELVSVSGGRAAVIPITSRDAARPAPRHTDLPASMQSPASGEWRLATTPLARLANELGMDPGSRSITPSMERASSAFARGLLRGLFDSDGQLRDDRHEGVSVRLAHCDAARLEAMQRMLLRLGIVTRLYRGRRSTGHTPSPDGRGVRACSPIAARHELVICGDNLGVFRREVGFADIDKQCRLDDLLARHDRPLGRERFTARVLAVEADGEEDVYDVQIPGVHAFDANGLYVHNCGEQPLPPYGSCLLGSVNLIRFVEEPFTERARFNWETYREVVAVFTRMLDNVVSIHGLPLPPQVREIEYKRRHGMGFLGLGSALTMLRMKYGDPDSLAFTDRVAREMAEIGWETGIALAEEKGPAPIMEDEFEVTEQMLHKRPGMRDDGYRPGDRIKGRILIARYSRYMQQFPRELTERLAETGARFTHHTSIAPTGTISLSIGNNASNGIEPSFAHKYNRNVIREGRKTKEKIDVYSYELLAYRALVDPLAEPDAVGEHALPDYFIWSESVTPIQHVDVQAAAQKWIDSSISKTANVPTDYPFDDFKDIYLYAYEKNLKGCTTFRFNPEAFQGVLVKDKDLAGTTYRFTLDDGEVIEARGNEEIEYDGEIHTAANLYDALKEGYYGRF